MEFDLAELIKDNAAHDKPTELTHSQFLALTLKQNEVLRDRFAKDILGKRASYLSVHALHHPNKHFASKPCKKGFSQDIAEKLAPLFQEPPYNTADFWMLGTHTIESLNNLPTINKDMLPDSTKQASRGRKALPENAVEESLINSDHQERLLEALSKEQFNRIKR